MFGSWEVFAQETWTWLRRVMSTSTAACVDVSRSLGCQFFPCLLWLMLETFSPWLAPEWHYNVIPRLNELQFRMVVLSGVWINYVSVVSDDNEMITLSSLSTQYQVPRWSPTQNSCPTLFWAEKSATSCKLVKTRKIRQTSSQYFHAVLDI